MWLLPDVSEIGDMAYVIKEKKGQKFFLENIDLVFLSMAVYYISRPYLFSPLRILALV